MSKIIVFSDLHAHAFRNYATVLPDGMNSRLADAVACINQIRSYALQHGIKLVLFGGDMFHVRRTISVQAFNAVYDALAGLHEAGIQVVMIHGNHDQSDKHGTEHSIKGFDNYVTVIEEPGWHSVVVDGQPVHVLGVPYIEDTKHLADVLRHDPPQGHRIFLGHLGVQGAKVGADFVYSNPADPTTDELCPDLFDVGFLGHYHMYQNIVGNFWYVGSPLQHNWGDKGQKRGFVVYDTATRKHEHVELTAPKFVEVAGRDSLHTLMGCDSYVRVLSDKVWSEDEREHWRAILDARSFEVVVTEKTDTDLAPRIQLSPGMSFSDMIDTYVKSGIAPTTGLDTEYLVSVGQSILDEISD